MYPMDARILEDLWVRFPMSEILKEHLSSLKKSRRYRRAPDPYSPKTSIFEMARVALVSFS